MFKKYQLVFSLSIFVCPFPVKRKNDSTRSQKQSRLEQPNFLDNIPKYVSVFTLFCLIRRHFRSSTEALKIEFFALFNLFTWNEYIRTHSYIC